MSSEKKPAPATKQEISDEDYQECIKQARSDLLEITDKARRAQMVTELGRLTSISGTVASARVSSTVSRVIDFIETQAANAKKVLDNVDEKTEKGMQVCLRQPDPDDPKDKGEFARVSRIGTFDYATGALIATAYPEGGNGHDSYHLPLTAEVLDGQPIRTGGYEE